MKSNGYRLSIALLAANRLVLLILLSSILASASQNRTSHNDIVPNQTLMGFKLGKNTLEQVRLRLGNSAVHKCSRKEEASAEICYVSSASDHTTVVFESGFSGDWKEIDGFKIISPQSLSSCYQQCASSALISEKTSTDGGLRLGLTEQELTEVLGKPVRRRQNSLRFQWHSRQRMTKEEEAKESKVFAGPVTDPYWDVLDTIDVKLMNAKISEIEVHHTVSY